MDRKFGDENPKNVYTMHDGNAFAIDVVALNNSSNNNNNNNNNNNGKMDDANQTTNETKMLTRNNLMRKESINGDRSSDVLQQLNTDDAFGQQNEQLVDLSYLRNDNQSNTSDMSDNNSTDNISFVSDDSDQRLNLSDQRLNHFSDEESNSDDIVYAYRGANFEPVDANADDETDYLEMDFEPDPASEIEQEHPQNVLPNHVGAAVSPHFEQAAIFEVPSHSHNNESHLNALIDNFNCSGSEWLATHEIRINGIDIKKVKPNNGIQTDRFSKSPNSNSEFRMENNNALNWLSNTQRNNQSVENTENKTNSTTSTVSVESRQQNVYYDRTVSLSTTKYTGTIPKTSRSNNRAVKTKPAAAIANGNDPIQFNYESQPSCSHQSESSGMIFNNSWNANNNKRWKINDESQSTSLLNCDNATASTSSHLSAKHVTSRMCFMPFPFAHEDMLSERNDGRSNEPKSQPSLLTLSNNDILYGSRGELINYDEQNIDLTSVTFRSSYCSLDTIANALKSINVLPNMTVLQEALQIDECEVPSMNIPKYLIHVSKMNCNYKAIMSAIERSCSNVNVRFFEASDELVEWVHIPVQAILSRLPYNGSLANILNIRNKRFHQANVLGKIVSTVRRYADMRNDVNHNEFIAIPQFYRTGFICVEPCTQQNQS